MHNILRGIKQGCLAAAAICVLQACTTVNTAMQETRTLMESGKLVAAQDYSRSSRWTLPANAQVYLARNSNLDTARAGAGAALTATLQNALQAPLGQQTEDEPAAQHDADQ